MNSERFQQIEQIYHAALELEPDERERYLASVCGQDIELKREVESLLASLAEAENFIETPPDHLAAAMIAERHGKSMIGRMLSDYRIDSLIGAGGMGEVYRAYDTRHDRQVAVKVLAAHLVGDADALNRFKREARAAAAISHPNVLSIDDYGTDNGVTFAVTELLEGETLRARLMRAPCSWQEAVAIAIPVGEGLAAAHARHIIHRDLKPENIFLTSDGSVKILDFGIARVKSGLKLETNTASFYFKTSPGVILGTRGYASPEQLLGGTVEAPGDIYSLGCVLSEMAGRDRPVELKQVIAKCLETHPDDRYQSAHELVMVLKVIRNMAIDLASRKGSSSGGAESR
jgi:eukaryotic-like serine/threonine-protein kinase